MCACAKAPRYQYATADYHNKAVNQIAGVFLVVAHFLIFKVLNGTPT